MVVGVLVLQTPVPVTHLTVHKREFSQSEGVREYNDPGVFELLF